MAISAAEKIAVTLQIATYCSAVPRGLGYQCRLRQAGYSREGGRGKERQRAIATELCTLRHLSAYVANISKGTVQIVHALPTLYYKVLLYDARDVKGSIVRRHAQPCRTPRISVLRSRVREGLSGLLLA